MKTTRSTLGIGTIALAFSAAVACSGGDGPGTEDLLASVPGEDPGTSDPTKEEEPEKTILDERKVDYFEALRLASMKLIDIPPTLEQIKALESASDKRAAYEEMVDTFLDSPRFNRRMIRFWRDTFRQGGGMLDSAPVFAAMITAESRPYTEILTATSGTCPTYDGESETFVEADCNNGVDEHAGVLTNPGVQAQFYGNMAFRRVRWVQETFACSKFPAEYADTPVPMGDGHYTAPWNFGSISNSPIDFQDTSSVICANCHASMNHLAPLFANFDADGNWQNGIQVETPIAPDPVTTQISHWLPDGETTAWRLGVPAASLPELGAAMAQDPEVMYCMTARLWNFTMSKEDIVSELAIVPAEVIEVYANRLATNGGDLRDALSAMFKSEDFVSF